MMTSRIVIAAAAVASCASMLVGVSSRAVGQTSAIVVRSDAKLAVSSSALRDGARLPNSMVFNGMGLTGTNTSPDISWSGAPPGTKSYAVTLYDPDAPTTIGFVHWLVFDIPARVTSLAAGAGQTQDAGVGAVHGLNDYGFRGFGGAAPPPGDPEHHYRLTVYALDVDKLGLGDTATYAMFQFMIRGHVLAAGDLTGRYSR